MEKHNREVQRQAYVGLKGLNHDSRVSFPELKLWIYTSCENLVSFNDTPAIIVTGQDQSSRRLIVREPDFILGDKPAGIVCKIQAPKGLEDTWVVDAIRQSCVYKLPP